MNEDIDELLVRKQSPKRVQAALREGLGIDNVRFTPNTGGKYPFSIHFAEPVPEATIRKALEIVFSIMGDMHWEILDGVKKDV